MMPTLGRCRVAHHEAHFRLMEHGDMRGLSAGLFIEHDVRQIEFLNDTAN
jgi:hypothetical protein